MARNELADVELYLHHETQTGWLVSTDGDSDEAVWIDKDKAERGESKTSRRGSPIYEFTMPQWYAEKKELV